MKECAPLQEHAILSKVNLSILSHFVHFTGLCLVLSLCLFDFVVSSSLCDKLSEAIEG